MLFELKDKVDKLYQQAGKHPGANSSYNAQNNGIKQSMTNMAFNNKHKKRYSSQAPSLNHSISTFHPLNLKHTLRNSISKLINTIKPEIEEDKDGENYIKQLFKEFQEEKYPNQSINTIQKLPNIKSHLNYDSVSDYDKNSDAGSVKSANNGRDLSIISNDTIKVSRKITQKFRRDVLKGQAEEKEEVLLSVSNVDSQINTSSDLNSSTKTVLRRPKPKMKLKDIFSKVFVTSQISSTNKDTSSIDNRINLISKMSKEKPIEKSRTNSQHELEKRYSKYNEIMTQYENQDDIIEIKDTTEELSNRMSNCQPSSNKSLVYAVSQTNDGKKEIFIKEKLKEEIKTFSLSVILDEEDDSYKSKTLYFKNEEYLRTKKMSKIGTRRLTEYFKYFILQKKNFCFRTESITDYVDAEIGYQFLDDENNCKVTLIM